MRIVGIILVLFLSGCSAPREVTVSRRDVIEHFLHRIRAEQSVRQFQLMEGIEE